MNKEKLRKMNYKKFRRSLFREHGAEAETMPRRVGAKFKVVKKLFSLNSAQCAEFRKTWGCDLELIEDGGGAVLIRLCYSPSARLFYLQEVEKTYGHPSLKLYFSRIKAAQNKLRGANLLLEASHLQEE